MLPHVFKSVMYQASFVLWDAIWVPAGLVMHQAGGSCGRALPRFKAVLLLHAEWPACTADGAAPARHLACSPTHPHSLLPACPSLLRSCWRGSPTCMTTGCCTATSSPPTSCWNRGGSRSQVGAALRCAALRCAVLCCAVLSKVSPTSCWNRGGSRSRVGAVLGWAGLLNIVCAVKRFKYLQATWGLLWVSFG